MLLDLYCDQDYTSMEYKCLLSLVCLLVTKTYGTMIYGACTSATDAITTVFGKALPSRHFTQLHGLSFLECREQCNVRRRCHSADYETRTRSCRINPSIADNDYGLIEASGMVHIRLQTWSDRHGQLPCETCTDGQSCDLHSEQCIYTECEALVAPENGYTEGGMVGVGATSMQYCDDNTYVINTVIVPVQTTCLSTGSWNVDTFTCHKLSDICNSNLVREATTGRILAKSITASSIYSYNSLMHVHGPYNGILDHTLAWSAAYNDVHQYIQAEFYGLKHIAGVVTQGRNSILHPQWITRYGLATSTDCITFTDLRDSNGDIVSFLGNTDINSKVYNVFEVSIEARCVRVKPTTWSAHISMRFDVLGCEDSQMSAYRLYQQH